MICFGKENESIDFQLFLVYAGYGHGLEFMSLALLWTLELAMKLGIALDHWTSGMYSML